MVSLPINGVNVSLTSPPIKATPSNEPSPRLTANLVTANLTQNSQTVLPESAPSITIASVQPTKALTYEDLSKPLVKQQALAREYQYSEQQAELSDFETALDSSARQADSGPLTTRGLLNQLGAIAASGDSYENSSRLYSRYTRTPEQVFRPNYQDNPGDKETLNSFSLTLTTQDGDTIQIDIGKDIGYGFGEDASFTEVNFAFQVDGELNQSEQEAVTKLAQQLGEVADGYFVNGSLSLNELSDFDSQQLSGFELELDGGRASYQYQIDDQQQTLNASFDNYNYQLQSSLNGVAIDSDLGNNDDYQNYLALLDQATQEYGTGNQIANFFKDGLDVLFHQAIEEANSPSDTGTTQTPDTQFAKGSTSGLVDFSATFQSDPFKPNSQRMDEVNMLKVTMEQTTKIQQQQGDPEIRLQQISKTELDVRQHKALPGLLIPDFEGQNYRYESLQQSQETVRTLLSDDGKQLDAAQLTQTEDRKHTIKDIRNGDLEQLQKDQQQYQMQLTLLALPKTTAPDHK